MTHRIDELVRSLPEVYQPIFEHPEHSAATSRGCWDRLERVAQVYLALERMLARPLKVLDLGCAQGFFSLHLAKLGASVSGVDTLEANIALCNALAVEQPELDVSFELRSIEDLVPTLRAGDYDLVLGLSVFHHIAHGRGSGFVNELLRQISSSSLVGLYEFASAEEPLYWAQSLPPDAREFLTSYAFVREIARFDTHLSSVSRPLMFASNRAWYLGDEAQEFKRWLPYSNSNAPFVHQGTRRYYFSDALVAKTYALDHPALSDVNISEWRNEISFLSDPPDGFQAPGLVSHGRSNNAAWIVRELIEGDLLDTIIAQGRPYSAEKVAREVLADLTLLEANELYHGDLRAWNVLIDRTGKARLIDFGSISESRKDCVPPSDVFLAFLMFVRELALGAQPRSHSIRPLLLYPLALPRAFREPALQLVRTWPAQRSFRDFQRALTEQTRDLSSDPAMLDLLLKVEEFSNHCQSYIERVEQALAAANSAIATHQGVSESLERDGLALAAALAEETERRERLADQLESALAQRNADKHEIEVRDKAISSLNAELEAANAAIQMRARQAEEHAAHLAQTQELLNAELRRASSLAASVDAAGVEKASLVEQLGQVSTARDQYEKDSNALRQELVVLRAKFVEAEGLAQSLRAELERIDQLAIQRAAAHSEELIAARADLHAREREVADRNAELASLEHALNVARGDADTAAARAKSLELQVRQVQGALEAMRNSTSWRLTAPMRFAKNLARLVTRGGWAWLTMRPGVRPRRIARYGVLSMSNMVLRRPILRTVLRPVLNLLPPLKRRMVAIVLHDRGPSPTEVAAITPTPAMASRSEIDLAPNVVRYLIFVDHTVRCPVNSGVQRVVRGLSSSMLAVARDVRFVRWDAAMRACVYISLEERLHLAEWNGPSVAEEERRFYGLLGGQLAQSNSSTWLLVPEVTHITYHAQQVTNDLLRWVRNASIRCGFTFYDAIPIKRTEFAALAPIHAEYMSLLRLADAVWPISDHVHADLIEYWRQNDLAEPATMPVVTTLHLPGASFDVARSVEADVTENLVLCVGTIEARKNQLTLVRAFSQMLQEKPTCGWRLVLVGNLHPDVSEELRGALGPSIQYLGVPTDDELVALYQRCAFTVFPSVEEGFGLPILESIWHARPCICADFGAMAEVARGGGCLTIDVRNADTIQHALERLIEEPSLLKALSAEAAARPLQTWDRFATALMINTGLQAASSESIIYYWVEATRAFGSNTGIQRVTRMLAKHLLDLGLRVIPVVWAGEAQVFQRASHEDLLHLQKWNGPRVDAWAEWSDLGAAPAGSVFLMPELPLAFSMAHQKLLRTHAFDHGLRTACLFYDAIPWKLSSIYSGAYANAHQNYMRVLSEYDVVMPISNWSRRDFVDLLDLGASDAAKVVGVELAGEFPETSRTTEVRAIESDDINILAVGTLEPRKNYETLLKAFAIARENSRRSLRLTIVGREDALDAVLSERVKALIAATPNVYWFAEADDRQLREHYARAQCTVFPSIEEGFGLPILESLWAGKPCICANFGAMAEVAEQGGCLQTDVRDERRLAEALVEMAENTALRLTLAEQAVTRPLRGWCEYASDVASVLGFAARPATVRSRGLAFAVEPSRRPRLSLCITTYNRASWLSAALANLSRLWPNAHDEVEIVVCDNASTDNTAEIVAPYLGREDFTYVRNPVNVGMLGNLRETALAANGEYVWILGDDDLLVPGAIEKVLAAIDANPGVALCYLNYAYTRTEDARSVSDFDQFIREATPIVAPGPDAASTLREVCAQNENFFTAIYTLVFRRDHAWLAYSQSTVGRPFSTMLTCIPTTHYVLNNMMEEPAVWIGEPQVVVNMNVSWMRYAPLWILERIPEVYDVAEARGVPQALMDGWRRHTLPSVIHYFREILHTDPEGNARYFSPSRLVARFAHLEEFRTVCEAELITLYEKAHGIGAPAAQEDPKDVFAPLKKSDLVVTGTRYGVSA
ncbi:glycosyltransferase [Vitreimonas flagellata]|uniref:glycosyltransferase n=1 Tax=Vitreimonas flagellata TaxID=2560861 RepID=UPI001074B859|nr:glycosyltransferase [Vitreimonas flagellata]